MRVGIHSSISTGPFSMNWTYEIPTEDTSFGNLFYDPYINDSLPHFAYRRIADSIKRIKDEIQLSNKGVGSGVIYGPIGLENFERKFILGRRPAVLNDILLRSMDDTLNNIEAIFPVNSYSDSVKRKKYSAELLWRYNVRSNQLMQEAIKKADRVYCLTLNGYTTNYDNKFFVHNDKFYLATIKWDSVIKRPFDSTKVGHYERKEIPVRYSAEDKKIQIPISKTKYDLLKLLFEILFYIFLFSMILILFGLPIQILVDISRGKAFTKSNIRRFKIMAFVLFSFVTVKIFAPYLIKFAYRKSIPSEFRLESIEYPLTNNMYLLVIAVALFMVAKAFQKGYNLQQEQDLTI